MITPATGDDLEEIVALEESFPAKERWSGNAWVEELDDPSRTTFVYRDGDDVLGVAIFSRAGDVAELFRVVVDPDARRRGIADALMEEGLRGLEGRVLLEVRDDNEPAQRLYKKHGFEVIHRRPDYYGNGVDALIFERPDEQEAS